MTNIKSTIENQNSFDDKYNEEISKMHEFSQITFLKINKTKRTHLIPKYKTLVRSRETGSLIFSNLKCYYIN